MNDGDVPSGRNQDVKEKKTESHEKNKKWDPRHENW